MSLLLCFFENSPPIKVLRNPANKVITVQSMKKYRRISKKIIGLQLLNHSKQNLEKLYKQCLELCDKQEFL